MLISQHKNNGQMSTCENQSFGKAAAISIGEGTGAGAGKDKGKGQSQ
jgi:hypothetical protein